MDNVQSLATSSIYKWRACSTKNDVIDEKQGLILADQSEKLAQILSMKRQGSWSTDRVSPVDNNNKVFTEEINFKMDYEEKPYTIISKVAAEFVGDLIFVFVGCMSGLRAAPDNVIHGAFAHGLTIFALVTSLGHISGGHFNPAVTLSIALSNKMPIWHLPLYWVGQLTGGFCGALLCRAITLKDEYDTFDGGATYLHLGDDWYQGLISEAMLTFILTQTVLLTAVDTDKNVLAPLAIGMCLTLDIFAAGSITGASMNPARSLGPCVVMSIFAYKNTSYIWKTHYIYWAGPFIGASVSAFLYRTIFGRGRNRLLP
uniref:Aquaporin-8 n=1 Tax=Acrobeloides nanus TaxID=290746 RepID=A0A914CXT7_9BILA